jgi:hypothetical protein
MDYHQNARLTIHSREQLARAVLENGCTLKSAAAEFKVSAKTAAKSVSNLPADTAPCQRNNRCPSTLTSFRLPASSASYLVRRIILGRGAGRLCVARSVRPLDECLRLGLHAAVTCPQSLSCRFIPKP